jgi:hypothetical protein
MWRIDGFTKASGVAPKSYFGSLHVEKRGEKRACWRCVSFPAKLLFTRIIND